MSKKKKWTVPRSSYTDGEHGWHSLLLSPFWEVPFPSYLGMMRANIWIVILAMTIGKVLRYALLVWGVLEASALMK